MASFRTRGDGVQAIIRIKEHGVLVFNEARTFTTMALAKDWAKRTEAKIRSEGAQAVTTQAKTLSALIDDYLKVRNEHRAPSRSIEHDLGVLDQYLGKQSLHALRADTWASFARKRRGEGAGPATVMHQLSTARAMLNAARPLFGLDIDGTEVGRAISALRLTGHVANSKLVSQRVTDADLDRLREEFNRIARFPSTTIRMTDVIDLAVPLPRRLSELCSMRWEDYDGRLIRLHDTKHPRGPRQEIVPVPRAAKLVLARIPRTDERILPFKADSVSAAFERACDRIGLEKVRFHDLRHEGISRLFEQGLSIPEVSAVSGHTSWTNLKRYTHLTTHVMEKTQ
jgi:integrase